MKSLPWGLDPIVLMMIIKNRLVAAKRKLAAIRRKGVLDVKNADRREDLHRLFAYPAMMVPAAQYAVIDAVASCLPKKVRAIDPFMGSGTSLLTCAEFGFNAFGQDINPLAVLLSKAKTCVYNIDGLRKACQRALKGIESDCKETIEVDFKNINKWFNRDVQIGLSKIRRSIIREKDGAIRSFLWIALSEVIRIGSNDRTSTFKLHMRSAKEIEQRRVNVIEEFKLLVERGIKDAELYQEKLQLTSNRKRAVYQKRMRAEWGDSKSEIVADGLKFDLLVSSPPYGDNHTTVTYGQTSYLPLQWIAPGDLSCSYDYLRTTQEIDRRSLGGVLKQKDIIEQAALVLEKSPALKEFFTSIPREQQSKYYKTLSFWIDFDLCLSNIAPRMKKGAFYIWTIGNRFVGNREIPNDEILIDMMAARNVKLFERAERRIYNKKQPKRNNYSRTMEKEHILIFH